MYVHVIDMKKFYYILILLCFSAFWGNATTKYIDIINSMSDIEVKLSLADKKMPLMLRISSKSAKDGQLIINKNSLLSGIVVFVKIKCKNSGIRYKLFANESTALIKSDYASFPNNTDFLLQYATSSMFHEIYQKALGLGLSDAKKISIRLHFNGLTEVAEKEAISYMTNFIEFSPEELLEIAALYKNFVDDYPFSIKDWALMPKSFYLSECEKVNTALGDKALFIKKLRKK